MWKVSNTQYLKNTEFTSYGYYFHIYIFIYSLFYYGSSFEMTIEIFLLSFRLALKGGKKALISKKRHLWNRIIPMGNECQTWKLWSWELQFQRLFGSQRHIGKATRKSGGIFQSRNDHIWQNVYFQPSCLFISTFPVSFYWETL